MIRTLVRSRRRVIESRVRRVPGFATSVAQRDYPVVYYVAPDRQRPSGGIRVIYRHVDILNSLGIEAAVMHAGAGFRCTWFENQTTVVHGPRVTLGPRDVIVVPEWYGPSLHLISPIPRLVVFNQRAYDTFDWIDLDRTIPGAPYSGLRNLAALLTVSLDNTEYLRYAFPDLRVQMARNVIDGSVFHIGAAGQRARRVAVVPSRRQQELVELQHILRSRGALGDWSFFPIVARSEQQTAEILRNSAVFLSLSEREGFGLPPAEAMASGCLVVGYPGLAGREFFHPTGSMPVPDGDIVALAKALEGACLSCDHDPETVARMTARASHAVLERYSHESLRNDLTDFYRPLVGS